MIFSIVTIITILFCYYNFVFITVTLCISNFHYYLYYYYYLYCYYYCVCYYCYLLSFIFFFFQFFLSLSLSLFVLLLLFWPLSSFFHHYYYYCSYYCYYFFNCCFYYYYCYYDFFFCYFWLSSSWPLSSSVSCVTSWTHRRKRFRPYCTFHGLRLSTDTTKLKLRASNTKENNNRGRNSFCLWKQWIFSPKLYQSLFFERKGACLFLWWLVFAWLTYLIQSAKNTMDGTILST